MIRYLFWISLFFVIYTYLFYPLIIVCMSRLRRKVLSIVSIESGAGLPSITMIIIVYNEDEYIMGKLQNCRELDYPEQLLTICMVSDGSTDRTNEILRSQHDIKSIEDPMNHGKPYQINKAVQGCESEIIVFSDVRQMYEPDALRKLVRNFSEERVGAVSGELIFRPHKDRTGASIGLYWKYEKLLRKAESSIDSTLGATGAIYAIRREFFTPIKEDTILDDIEIPLLAFKKGYRVVFEPEAIAYDTAHTEIQAEFKRKVRTLAGNFQLFSRNPWLLNPFANRIFLQTVSHKLFRLLIPYALIILFLASILMEGIAYKTFFAIQALCYGTGIASLASKNLRKNRLLNLISVFISLNAASVIALYRFSLKRADVRWKK